eukprot:5633400-Prymnesium_polylepis.1
MGLQAYSGHVYPPQLQLPMTLPDGSHLAGALPALTGPDGNPLPAERPPPMSGGLHMQSAMHAISAPALGGAAAQQLQFRPRLPEVDGFHLDPQHVRPPPRRPATQPPPR